MTHHFGPPTENDARTRTGNQWLKDNPLPAALKQNLEARSGKGNELALFHCSTHLSYIVRLSKLSGRQRTHWGYEATGVEPVTSSLTRGALPIELRSPITQNYGPPDFGRATIKAITLCPRPEVGQAATRTLARNNGGGIRTRGLSSRNR